MNYVVDANLSPRLAVLLQDAGHDAVHVRDIGLRSASDDELIDYAISTDRIVISHDTDFGTLLAYRVEQAVVHLDSVIGPGRR